MAEVLEKFERIRGVKNKYPWDQWGDGRVWKVTKGVDFECTPPSLANAARSAARTRKKYCRHSIGEDFVVLQFVAPKDA